MTTSKQHSRHHGRHRTVVMPKLLGLALRSN